MYFTYMQTSHTELKQYTFSLTTSPVAQFINTFEHINMHNPKGIIRF